MTMVSRKTVTLLISIGTLKIVKTDTKYEIINRITYDPSAYKNNQVNKYIIQKSYGTLESKIQTEKIKW